MASRKKSIRESDKINIVTKLPKRNWITKADQTERGVNLKERTVNLKERTVNLKESLNVKWNVTKKCGH